MRLDFASEYARRSDDELRLLIKDRHDLVDEARDALDAEVHKRRSSGFDPHAQEPEEPRVHVEEDEEEGNEVVVRSRELRFPEVCPRCLEPADSIAEISCSGDSTWGFFPAFDIVRSLWGYLFYRYSVPFCRKCARSVRVRRWSERVFFLVAGVGSVYIAERFRLSIVMLLLILFGVFGIPALLWHLLHLSKLWPPPGIEISSKWSARERRLEFARPEYERAFIAANGRHAQRE